MDIGDTVTEAVHLPQEILDHILDSEHHEEYDTHRSHIEDWLLFSALVSRAWCQAARRPAFRRLLAYRKNDATTLHELLRSSLETIGKHVKELLLHGRDFNLAAARLTTRQLHGILERLPSLQRLHLRSMHLPLERSPLVELPAPWVKLDKLTLANVVIFAGSLDAGGGFVYFFSIFSEIRSITLRNGFDARFDACIPDPECSDSRDSDVFTKVSETDLDLPTPPAAPPTVHDHCPPLPPLSTQLRVHKLSFKSGPRWVFWNTVRQDLQRCIALGDLDVIRIEDIDVGRVRRVVDELGRRAACIRVDIEMQDEGRVEPDSLVLSGNPRLRKLRLVVRSDAVYPYLNAEKLQFIAETLGSIPTSQLADLGVETNLHASSSYQSIPSDTLKRVEETLTSLDLDKEMESMRLDIGVCSVNASHQRKVSPEDRALMLSMQDSVKLHMPRLFRRDAVHIILADRTEYAQEEMEGYMEGIVEDWYGPDHDSHSSDED